MFTCPTSGICVQYCDGSIDCEDGSDENSFECALAQAQCENKNLFLCPLSKKCISKLWHCDGQDDCIDGFDEMNCSATSVSSSNTMGNRAMVEDYMESHSNPMKVNSQTFVKVYDLE